MPQIRIAKPKPRPPAANPDLRTPSGRLLPY